MKIYWFRKALRVHDNQGLYELSQQKNVLFLFCLDPFFVQKAKVGSLRWLHLYFIIVHDRLETLQDLNSELEKRHQRLIVFRGTPSKVFEKLFKVFKPQTLYFEEEQIEPYGRMRDEQVHKLADQHKVKVKTFIGHSLYDLTLLLEKSGTVLLKYQSFLSLLSSLPPVEEPVEAPEEMLPMDEQIYQQLLKEMKEFSGPDKDFRVPTMKELGKELQTDQKLIFKGGETEALKQMSAYLSNLEKTCQFEKPKTSPTLFSKKRSTTVLSPYLKFGSLSCRTFYHALNAAMRRFHGKKSEPPVSLLGQLLWREFYYYCACGVENFHKMEGNAICLQAGWKLKDTEDMENQEGYDHLMAWKNAQTGFPWIDAVMTQLRTEGWIHHLARHAVACFLTRGDLYISWERGLDVFEEWLLDADYALNAGNWMWLSASCFFYQFFRVYNPISFAKKYDKNGKFIRHYLPVLKDFPSQYIYEPWKAPKEIQVRAKCIIGKDYPMPIIDHDEAKNECIRNMQAAYQEKKDHKRQKK